MKKILFLILLLNLPMSNLSAREGNKFYSPVIELYEKVKSNISQFYNKEYDSAIKENLNSNFQAGFDFVCFNSCKERNNDGFCRKQCSLP